MDPIILSYFMKSLVMTIIILVVSIFNVLFAKVLTAKLRYTIWLIVLLGLLIPLPLLVSNGLITIPAGNFMVLPLETRSAAPLVAPVQPSVPDRPGILSAQAAGITPIIICLLVWGMVATAIFAWHIRQYICFLRTVRRWGMRIQDEYILPIFRAVQTEMGLSHRKINLISCSFVTSSMLTGFVRPAILLPDKQYESDELEFIFKHELIHYKRCDLIIKLLTVAAISIYWFNPAVYWLCGAIQADGEASCDEEVLLDSGKENRHFYAEIIIGMISEMSATPSILTTSFLYRGKFAIKKRLNSIMDAALKPRWPVAFSLTTVMALTVLSGSVFAFTVSPPHSGSSMREGITTVAEALHLRDGTYITLEGRIEQFLGGEAYSFSDGTGTITLEIDRGIWGNLRVSEHDIIEITGEIERDFRSIEVEVNSIRKVPGNDYYPAGIETGFSGPRTSAITVAEALTLHDDAPVILQGTILRFLGNARYMFSDETGTIVLEMDRSMLDNQWLNEHDLMEISGEIERSIRRIEVEVKNIRKL